MRWSRVVISLNLRVKRSAIFIFLKGEGPIPYQGLFHLSAVTAKSKVSHRAADSSHDTTVTASLGGFLIFLTYPMQYAGEYLTGELRHVLGQPTIRHTRSLSLLLSPSSSGEP